MRHHDDMPRTTLSLSDDLLRRLRSMAAETGVSMATVVREALEEKTRNHRPKPRSLGVGCSGQSDTARRAGDERMEPRSWR